MKKIMLLSGTILLWSYTMQGCGSNEALLYQAILDKDKERVSVLLDVIGVAPVFTISSEDACFREEAMKAGETISVNTLNFALDVYVGENDPSLVRVISQKTDVMSIIDTPNFDDETPRALMTRLKKELMRKGSWKANMSNEDFLRLLSK